MPNGLKQVVMGFVNSVNFYQGKDSKIETRDRYLVQENLINVVKYASNKGVMTQDEYDYFMAKVDNLSIKRMFEIKEGKYTDHNLTRKQLKELPKKKQIKILILKILKEKPIFFNSMIKLIKN